MNKFVRTIAVRSLSAVLLVCVTGCFGPAAPPPDVPLEDIIGTWVCEKEGSTITYTFTKDMKYTKNESGASTSASTSLGTYTLEGNILTTNSNLGGSRTHEISEFEGTRMVWGNGSITAEYIKQTKKK